MSSFLVAGGIHRDTLGALGPSQFLVGEWWVPIVSAAQGCRAAGGALWLCTQGQAGVGVKHCCSWLLHRNVGEERQERQELCSKEVEQGRAAAAPSLPPHTPTAPLPPAPDPCLALSTGRKWLRQWLPPSAAAAVSRHHFPGAPYLAELIPQPQGGCQW